MPDALSKTVPIWCAVINRALWNKHSSAQELFTPDDVVGESEHAQINARLDGFLKDVKVSTSASFTPCMFLSSTSVGLAAGPFFSPRCS